MNTDKPVSAKEAVGNGVEFLDKYYSEWPDKVNLYSLHMRKYTECVLFHVAGKISKVQERFDVDRRWLVDHGFILPDKEWEWEYADLQREWERVVKERKGIDPNSIKERSKLLFHNVYNLVRYHILNIKSPR